MAAVVGLWIVDLALNGLAAPCRALVADIAPSKQEMGNSLMAGWASLGGVTGFVICTLPWSR